jgi:uncharacterized membrane protein
MLKLMGHFTEASLGIIAIVGFVLLAFSFLSLAAFGSYRYPDKFFLRQT